MSPSPGLRAGTVMLTEIVGNVIILTDFERIESHHRREPLSVSSQRPQPPGRRAIYMARLVFTTLIVETSPMPQSPSPAISPAPRPPVTGSTASTPTMRHYPDPTGDRGRARTNPAVRPT